MEQFLSIEQLLEEGKIVQISPRGYSMYPLLVPGRDMVLVEKAHPAEGKRGDVLLYRRENGMLVLHRVYRHKTEGYYMVGDNQSEIEGPLQEQQIKGKMIGIVRKGKRISVKNPIYLLYSRVWLVLRIFRPVIGKSVHAVLKILKKR